MKKKFLSMIAVVFLLLIFGSWSWAQCPEDSVDRGVCDTLNVICLDCEIDTTVPGPYFVRFPLLVTHDQIGSVDSIGGFVIPLAWTHTNPSKYCSLGSWWNNTDLYPYPSRDRSIFRHITDPVTGDTLIYNRMMTLSEDFSGREWDYRIVELSTDPAYMRMVLVPMGTADQRWWEGDRTLLATMTFRIEDTMHVCIDTTFWPPTSRLAYSRSDGKTYIPRHNLPHCFWVGVPGQPDFTIEATPDTQTVQAGQAANYNVTLTSQFGFASPCTLTVTGLPAGADADFTPNPLVPTGSSVMNVNTSAATTPPGTYELTITATELTKAEIVHDTTVVLVVTSAPDFTIKLEPDTLEVQAGNSVNCNVILDSLYGFSSACTLTISGLPTNASESFTPNPVVPPDTSDLQINTEVTTPPDTYTVTVTASEIDKGIVHDAELVLIVTPLPDFTIKLEPDTLEVQAGNSINGDVILTSLYGFASPCTLTATGLPDYTSADFDPNPITPTDTSLMTISTADTTPPNTYNMTITASEIDKGIVHDAELVLIVTPPPDFSIEASPETLSVPQGGQDSFEVILTSLYGFNSPCTLTVSGIPQDASGVFDPPTLIPTNTSALTISVAQTTPTGTCTLTITATELVPGKNQVQHSVEVVLVVHPPEDFAIEVFPDTIRISRGTDSSYTVKLTAISGFNSPCTLKVAGLPEGVEGTFESPVLVPTDSTKLNISVIDTADTSTSILTIFATEIKGDKKIEHSKDVTLIVTLDTCAFYIEVYPDTQEVVVGDSTTYHVAVFCDTDFWVPCTLSIESGLPTGASYSFDPNPVSPEDTSLLTVFTSASTPAGIYDLIIRATSCCPNHEETTTTVTLVVQDFTISASPDVQHVTPGQAVGYEVMLTSLFEFDEPCTLFVSGLPDPPDSGIFDQATLIPTDTTTLNVYTSVDTDTGWYTLSITAQRMPGTKLDGLQHSVEVMLRVEEPGDAGDWADNPNTPKSFALFQNQPNPFNPETKISYYLPRACQVRLTIYNVLGQKVKTLFDDHQNAGTQTLLWDGRGDDGVQLSSGIYFYRLQADSFQETKKMTLMK